MSESLDSFLSTRGVGGTVGAIEWVAGWFSKNPNATLHSYTSKLDSGKAVSLYGGYISNKFGIEANTVYTMRTVIGAKYADLDAAVLSDSKEDFLDEFDAIERDFNAERDRTKSLAELIGKDTAKAVDSIVRASKKITPKSHISRETRVELEAVLSHLQAILGKSPVSVVGTDLVTA
jgi:hypothetical protein